VLLPHESTHPAWRELPNIRLERAGLAGRSPGALAAREERMSQSERWQLGGNAPEVYETELVPALFGPWAPLLVAKAALREGERVLDVACGTGVVTRLAAEQVGTGDHVVGVDLNPGMLARARAASVPRAPSWNGGKLTLEHCPLVRRASTLSSASLDSSTFPIVSKLRTKCIASSNPGDVS